MISVNLDYIDYRNNHKNREFWFGMNEAEMMAWQNSKEGGLQAYLESVAAAKSEPALQAQFDDLIKRSYGVISDDGESFLKTDENWLKFKCSDAYNQLILRLIKDDKYAVQFVRGIFPEGTFAELKEGAVDVELDGKTM